MERNSATESGRRVGDLAATAGLTVRTMHHDEEIGLLVPERWSAAVHHIYGSVDIDRLYRIRQPRRAGLSFDRIANVLDDHHGPSMVRTGAR